MTRKNPKDLGQAVDELRAAVDVLVKVWSEALSPALVVVAELLGDEGKRDERDSYALAGPSKGEQ